MHGLTIERTISVVSTGNAEWFEGNQSHCFALHEGNSDIYCFTVPLGSIPELPAQSCQEIKLSEGKDTVSNMYWLDESGKGNAVLDYCDMAISGKTLKKLNKMIFSLKARFFHFLHALGHSLFAKFVFNSFISGRIPLSCKEIWTNKRYGFFYQPAAIGKFISLKSQRSSRTKPIPPLAHLRD